MRKRTRCLAQFFSTLIRHAPWNICQEPLKSTRRIQAHSGPVQESTTTGRDYERALSDANECIRLNPRHGWLPAACCNLYCHG